MPTTITAFFDRYRQAFAERDLAALLELFHVPCLVLSDDAITAPASTAELGARLRAQFERHASAGVAMASFHLLAHRRLDARFVRAEVRWRLTCHDGATLPMFDLMYVLVASESGWRITVVAPLESIGQPPES